MGNFLGGWYLSEILYTSPNVKSSKDDVSKNLCYVEWKLVFISNISHPNIKNSEDVVKSGCFWKILRWRTLFFLNEGGGY